MNIESILGLPPTHEHYVHKIVEAYSDVPKETIKTLRTSWEGGDHKITISTDIPDVGPVVDLPVLPLSKSAIMVLGETWLAILELFNPESEAANG